MNTIIHIFNSAIRELKRLFKNSNLVLVLLVAPLAYPALYEKPIYILKYESKVPVAIVDNDNSSLSARVNQAVGSTSELTSMSRT